MEAVLSSETTRRYVSEDRNLQKHSSRYLNFVVLGFLAAVFATITFQFQRWNDDGKGGLLYEPYFLSDIMANFRWRNNELGPHKYLRTSVYSCLAASK
jgi:hypothetical protein